MAKRQPPKRLFRSRDVITEYKNTRTGFRAMNRMAEEHSDVLQNIEFALVASREELPGVDDRVVHEALRNSMDRKESADPVVADVVERLDAVMRVRTDVPVAVWRNAMNIVAESVRRHSQFQPGETSYLDFAAEYLE